MNNLVENAKEYACNMHNSVNQMYGDLPYTVHIEAVYNAALQFIHLVPVDNQDKVLAACWAHDVIEDCRQTYNDVKKVLGEEVADIVYDVTDELGKNRRERGAKTHPKIRANKYALFVKLADRYSNVKASKEGGSRMYEVYKREMPEFKEHLDTGEWPEMWAALLEL